MKTSKINGEWTTKELQIDKNWLMNLDHLDIFCLHRDNPEIPVEEFIDELNKLQSSGLFTLFGASNWTLERFRKANEYATKNNKEGFKVLSNIFSVGKMNKRVGPGGVS